MKFLIIHFPSASYYLLPLQPKVFVSTLFLNTLSLRSSLNVSDQL